MPRVVHEITRNAYLLSLWHLVYALVQFYKMWLIFNLWTTCRAAGRDSNLNMSLFWRFACFLFFTLYLLLKPMERLLDVFAFITKWFTCLTIFKRLDQFYSEGLTHSTNANFGRTSFVELKLQRHLDDDCSFLLYFDSSWMISDDAATEFLCFETSLILKHYQSSTTTPRRVVIELVIVMFSTARLFSIFLFVQYAASASCFILVLCNCKASALHVR